MKFKCQLFLLSLRMQNKVNYIQNGLLIASEVLFQGTTYLPIINWIVKNHQSLGRNQISKIESEAINHSSLIHKMNSVWQSEISSLDSQHKMISYWLKEDELSCSKSELSFYGIERKSMKALGKVAIVRIIKHYIEKSLSDMKLNEGIYSTIPYSVIEDCVFFKGEERIDNQLHQKKKTRSFTATDYVWEKAKSIACNSGHKNISNLFEDFILKY